MAWNPSPEVAAARDFGKKFNADRVIIIYANEANETLGYAMAKKQCPEFPFFGASYNDACCIDGYLWDLDSCDDADRNTLTSGGDEPCPFCNRAEAVERLADHLWSSGDMTKRAALKEARRRLADFRKKRE